MKKYSNATIQDLVDGHQYGSITIVDGAKQAKVGLDIYRQVGENEWVLVSSNGIKNPELHGVPKTLGRKWSR